MNSVPFLSHGEQFLFKSKKQPKCLGRVVYDNLMNSAKCFFYEHTFVVLIRNDINLNEILHISAQTCKLLLHISKPRVLFHG